MTIDKSILILRRELAVPFPVDRISWRIGNTNAKQIQRETKDPNARPTKGRALAYIDARDVQKRLDDVMGIDGWETSFVETPEKRVLCHLMLHFPKRSVTKTDGAGASDMEGEKGAISDALKRAAVSFGIGRYLYDLDAPMVTLDAYGHIPKDQVPVLPPSADPDKWRAAYNKHFGLTENDK